MRAKVPAVTKKTDAMEVMVYTIKMDAMVRPFKTE